MVSKGDLNFRYDIQALRALAVLLVMLFHAKHSWAPGGFLGVDIFFTISGYVIFRMIRHDILLNKFQFSEFYKRRILRLFPAFFITILLTCVLTFLLFPEDLVRPTIKSAIWSLILIPNVYFFLDGGYFSQAAIHEPLLHLWSLGVEEQFYVFFPLFIFVVFKYFSKAIFLFLLLLFLFGCAYSQHLSWTNPDAAFYLFHSRVFQFSAGAMVVLLPSLNVPRKLCLRLWVVTLFSILYICFLAFEDTTQLPGWRGGILACLTALLLYIGQIQNLNLKLTNNAKVQWFGNTSYSLYLVHWPVGVFLNYQLAGSNSNLIAISTFALSLFLGWLMYNVIEKPFRKSTVSVVLRVPVALALITVTLSWFGWENRKEPGQELPTISREILQPIENVFLVGDSHANVFRDIIKEGHVGKNYRFLIFPGCPPIVGVHKTYTVRGLQQREDQCSASQEKWFEELSEVKEALVIFAARWEFYVKDMVEGFPSSHQDWLVKNKGAKQTPLSRPETRRALKFGLMEALKSQKGNKVVVVGQVSQQFIASIDCAKRRNDYISDDLLSAECGAVKRDSAERAYESLRSDLREVTSVFPYVQYLDPIEILCDSEYCGVTFKGNLLYSDTNHLTFFGTQLIFNAINWIEQ